MYVLGYVAEEFEKTVLYFQTKINKWHQPPPYNTILTGTAILSGLYVQISTTLGHKYFYCTTSRSSWELINIGKETNSFKRLKSTPKQKVISFLSKVLFIPNNIFISLRFICRHILFYIFSLNHCHAQGFVNIKTFFALTPSCLLRQLHRSARPCLKVHR